MASHPNALNSLKRLQSFQGTVAGIDIGGTKTAISQWSVESGLQEIERFDTQEPTPTLARAITAIKAIGPIDCIGIACGGPLDTKTGTILSPSNLPQWKSVRIVDAFKKHCQVPTFLLNDANANALAEWVFGEEQSCDSLVYLTAGTGMGAGIILNRQLVEGRSGNAGEVGHIRLASTGPRGYGKDGSFEGFCSGGGLPQLIEYMPEDRRPADWRMWQSEHPTTKSIALSASKGDPTARAIFAESGSHLGQALAILIDTLNPQRIVIGSLFLRCREFLEPTMLATLRDEALETSLQDCRITPSKLGESIGNYGAIATALRGIKRL